MVTSQMKLIRLVFAAVLAAALARFAAAAADAPTPAWQPQEMAFTAKRDHPWWEFPVRAVFCHNSGTTALTIEGFWDGGRHWVIRAALPQPGTWAWHTESADPASPAIPARSKSSRRRRIGWRPIPTSAARCGRLQAAGISIRRRHAVLPVGGHPVGG